MVACLVFLLPGIVHADVSQDISSTTTSSISLGVAALQTLGTGLSGTTTSIDIAYLGDNTYYVVRVEISLQECSSSNYDSCHQVALATNWGPWTGPRSFDIGDYELDPCKYYRLIVFNSGDFGVSGHVEYFGSAEDVYPYGAVTSSQRDQEFPADLYFVLHGADRLDRSANTPENLCVDPVIIVPGLLGSFEKNGVLLMDPILHAYDDLIATLEANGYVASSTLFTFPYNWRNSNVDTAILLKKKIDEIKQICNCAKIDLVAHSMGGLVARQYIQSDGYQDDVDQVIFLATPHLGAPKAYLAWEGGSFPVPSIDDWVVTRILSQEGKHLGFENAFDYIRNRPITSLKELLPIFDYKKVVSDDTLLAVDEIYPNHYPTNLFLENLQSYEGRLARVAYSNAVSLSRSTIGSIAVHASSSDGAMWEHGEPRNLVRGLALGTVDGDGTVPILSASSTGNNVYFDSGHTDIVSDASGYVFNQLTDRDAIVIVTNLGHTDGKFLLFLLRSPVDITVTAPDGKKIGYSSSGEINEIPGAFYSGNDTENEFIVIPQPLDGEYHIETTGTGEGAYTVAASSISGGSVSDVDYIATTSPSEVSRLILSVDTASISANLAIAPEPQPIVSETHTVADTQVVTVRSGGGSRRTPEKSLSTMPGLAPIQTDADPDKFMISIDIPIDRFIALMADKQFSSGDKDIPMRKTKELKPKGDLSISQVAAVVGSSRDDSSGRGFIGKIKERLKKLFFRQKNQ